MRVKPRFRRAAFFLLFLLASSLLVSLVPSVSATEYLNDGFEANNFAAWTGIQGSPTVQSTVKHHGAYAMSAVAAAYTNTNAYKVLASAIPEVYMRFNMRILDVGPADGDWIYLALLGKYGVGDIARFSLRNVSGVSKLYIEDVANAAEYNVAWSPTVNTWYSFELYAKIHDSTGVLTVWVDGVQLITQTGIDTDIGQDVDFCEVGMCALTYVASAKTVYFDCVVVADAYIGLEASAGEYYYVSNNSTNIDSSASTGGQSNFTAQQTGPDLINDTLTEANSSNSTSSFGYTTQSASSTTMEAVIVGSVFTASYTGWITTISANVSVTTTAKNSYGMVYLNSSLSRLGVSGQISLATGVNVRTWTFGSPIAVTAGTAYILTAYCQSTTGTGIMYYTAGATNDGVSDSDTYDSSPADPLVPTRNTNKFQIWANMTVPNYTLDLEEQWTGANYTRANEELCIFTGPFNGGTAENLMVNVWNTTSSAWNWAMNLTTNVWNNVSITGWLTSANFTIQFKDGTQTADTVQNTWQKDCTLLRTWDSGPAWVNNTLTGAVTLTGTSTRGISVATSILSQTLMLQGSLLAAKSKAYVLSQTITLQDAATRGISLSITVTSLSSIIDANTLTKELSKLSIETIQVVSTASALNGYLKTASSTAGIVPVLNSNIALLFTKTGNIAVIDSSELAKALKMDNVASISITDLAGSGKALVVTSAGALGIIDTAETAKALGISLSELLDILAATQEGKSLGKTLTDSITLEDILATLKELMFGQAETFSFSTAVQDVLEALKAMEKTGSGSIGIVPLAGTTKSIVVLPDGSLYLVDTASFLKAIGVTLAANQTLQDLIAQVKALQKSGVETVQVLSTVDGGKALLIMPDGTIQIVDATALLKALLFTQAGSVTVVDSETLGRALQISKVESISAIDSAMAGKAVAVTSQGALGIVDADAIAKALGIPLSELLQILDTNQKNIAAEKAFADTITINDVLQMLKAQAFVGTEALASDSATAQAVLTILKSIGKSNVDAIGVVPIEGSNKAIIVLPDGSLYTVDLSTFLKELGITLQEGQTLQDAISALKALQFGGSEAIQIIPVVGTNKAIIVLADGSILLVDLESFLKALGFTLPNNLQITDAATMNRGILAQIIEIFHTSSVKIKDTLGAWGNTLNDLMIAVADGEIEGLYVGVGLLSIVTACSCTWVLARRRNVTQAKTGFTRQT